METLTNKFLEEWCKERFYLEVLKGISSEEEPSDNEKRIVRKAAFNYADKAFEINRGPFPLESPNVKHVLNYLTTLGFNVK